MFLDRKLIGLLFTLSVFATACGDDGTTGQDAGPNNDSGVPPVLVDCPAGSLTVCSLKNPSDPFHPAIDDPIVLTDVVVTTPTISVSQGVFGLFYVQDPSFTQVEGGKYAGVAVLFNPSQTVGVVPPVGSIVTIDGTYTEFGQDGSTVQVQVSATRIESSGQTNPITPATVNPADIATGGSLSRAMEGSLVRVENVTVGEYNVTITTSPLFGSYKVDGDLIVWADRELYELERFWRTGEELGHVQGVLRLGTNPFNAGATLLSPRSREDWSSNLQTYKNISDIQGPGYAPSCTLDTNGFQGTCDIVELTRVLVTARGGFVSTTMNGETLRSIYIQTPNAQDPKYNGVKIVYNADKADFVPDVGMYVDVIGEVLERYASTQIEDATITRNGTDTGTPQAATVSPSSEIALDSQSARPYEGQLVRLENVTVTAACYEADPQDFGKWTVTGNVLVGTQFFYAYPGTCQGGMCMCGGKARTDDLRMMGDTFQSLSGVMDYSFNAWHLQPRSDADLVQ